MNRNNGLRIDTDGANESHMSNPGEGPRSQVDMMDPFAIVAATTGVKIGQNGNNGYGAAVPTTPLTPTTPLPITIGDFIHIAESLKTLMAETAGLRAESAGLRGIVKDLNIKIEEEKTKNRLGHRYSDASVTAAPTTPGGRATHGIAITPPAHRTALIEAFPSTPTLGNIPVTPTTQGMRSGINGSTGRRTGGSTRGRHRRTQTPTQNAIRTMTGGQPLHTWGMDPQDDRGLLSDFFDAIKVWAHEWTLVTEIMTHEKISELLSPGSIVFDFLGNTSDGNTILADDFLHTQLVAAVVSRNIVYHTLCENFLHVSGFSEAGQADVLVNEYNMLGEGNELVKHELLMQQKALYTAIKEQPTHRKLRSSKAKDLADVMVSELGHLLREAPATAYVDVADRDHALQDLYIRGFRIGFRMRMEASKWSMSWPGVGDGFDAGLMVNESRMLHGDAMKTLQRITLAPGNYAVRFALSPTITKSVYASGVEEKEIVHKGMVHLVRKANFIGAERGFFTTGARH